MSGPASGCAIRRSAHEIESSVPLKRASSTSASGMPRRETLMLLRGLAHAGPRNLLLVRRIDVPAKNGSSSARDCGVY
jgi:hypothetical protein